MLIVFSQLNVSVENKELKKRLTEQGCSIEYDDSEIVITNDVNVVRALTIESSKTKLTSVAFIDNTESAQSAKALDELHKICDLRELALFNISAAS